MEICEIKTLLKLYLFHFSDLIWGEEGPPLLTLGVRFKKDISLEHPSKKSWPSLVWQGGQSSESAAAKATRNLWEDDQRSSVNRNAAAFEASARKHQQNRRENLQIQFVFLFLFEQFKGNWKDNSLSIQSTKKHKGFHLKLLQNVLHLRSSIFQKEPHIGRGWFSPTKRNGT